jgi:hypothetical protein
MQALLPSPTLLSHKVSHHMTPNLGRATRPGEDVIVANELEMLVCIVGGGGCARGLSRYRLQQWQMSAIMICRMC